MTKRVVAIVQARMGSTRLPGKVLKEVLGKPLLGFLVERIRRSRLISELVIATSTENSDDIIADYCAKQGIAVYRGSEADVLSRYAEAAAEYKADYIVRICADSPLIDPGMIDEIIQEFLDKYPSCDYLSNTLKQTCPLGMNTEIFSFQALQTAHLKARLPYEREHVTPYIYSNPQLFSICQKHYQPDLSNFRLTVDMPEDFELVRTILEQLYLAKPGFSLSDVIAMLKEYPELYKINLHIQQTQINVKPRRNTSS